MPLSNFEILGVNSVNPNWNGSPTTLQVTDSVSVPVTSNVTAILCYQNTSKTAGTGKLALSWGSNYTSLTAQSLLNQPNIYLNNFNNNNLSITNISVPGSTTPIWVELYGPGIPGQGQCGGSSPFTLKPTQCGQMTLLPRLNQVTLQATSGSLTVLAIQGGPVDSSGNNVMVISLNDPTGNTGPGFSQAPPPNYFATTSNSYYQLEINWGSAVVYVVNLSPLTASAAKVTIQPL